MAENPIVTFEMEDGNVVIAELYPEIAPNTVHNFISLVQDGFYDGLIFHRVIPGFMIQGGCPEGVGYGNPGYSIGGEFDANGFENDLEHDAGVLSMARSQHPDSAGSQFFIMHEASPHLDGQYAAFGKVIDGQDVVDQIATTPRNRADKPDTPQVMKKVTVDTKGIDYPQPKTQ
ncbi:MAG: peptidylprolyl isomerase [Oscillospiraceae bacterium]|nr:peptidylprolyl isomerase [Oscillospiraceae bacterium]